jgi:hypothetical protein
MSHNKVVNIHNNSFNVYSKVCMMTLIMNIYSLEKLFVIRKSYLSQDKALPFENIFWQLPLKN